MSDAGVRQNSAKCRQQVLQMPLYLQVLHPALPSGMSLSSKGCRGHRMAKVKYNHSIEGTNLMLWRSSEPLSFVFAM